MIDGAEGGCGIRDCPGPVALHEGALTLVQEQVKEVANHSLRAALGRLAADWWRRFDRCQAGHPQE